jgi:micrococcal nuclease
MRRLATAFLSFLALLLVHRPVVAATPAVLPIPEGNGWAWVYRVVDGDTIDVEDEFGNRFRVRMIGIDTPETVAPNRPVECFGPEAAQRTREYVLGRWVWLERDVSQTDRYGRALRYVWTEEGGNLNAQLVYEGYARLATFPPDVKYAQWFLDMERLAREKGHGLWSGCPVRTRTAVPAPAPVPSVQGQCHPSYPDVCIPPPPPDLDCPDIPYRRFRVLPPDPHWFDGDGDGIGCET